MHVGLGVELGALAKAGQDDVREVFCRKQVARLMKMRQNKLD